MGKEGKGNSIPKDNSLLNKRKRVPLEEIDAKQNVKKKQRLIVKKNLKGIEKKKKGVKIPPRKKIEVEIEAEKQQLFHKRKQILTALKKALSSKTQNTKKTIKNLNVQLSTLNPDTASDEDKKKIEQFQKKLKNQTNSLEVLKVSNLLTIILIKVISLTEYVRVQILKQNLINGKRNTKRNNYLSMKATLLNDFLNIFQSNLY